MSSCATSVKMLSSRVSTLSSLRTMKKTRNTTTVKNVTVVGSGIMGSGIAQVTASSGFSVTLTDVRKDNLDNAMKTINKSLKKIAKRQSKNAVNKNAQSDFVNLSMERIKTSDNVTAAVADADLIIEAVSENLDLKRGLFAQFELSSKESAILATNTSSLRLEEIAKGITNKSRFGGLHFFNPVPIMKLVEVIRTEETSDDTFATLITFGQALGKTAVACKDTPGFIVNRLLFPYILEALRLYERGDASMTDIDAAMKLGAGFPMGPFELLDYVGLDTTKSIVDGWHEIYPDSPLFTPSELLDKLVAEGHLGRKTGEGFFSYKK